MIRENQDTPEAATLARSAEEQERLDSAALAAHYCADSNHWTCTLRDMASPEVAERILTEADAQLRKLRGLSPIRRDDEVRESTTQRTLIERVREYAVAARGGQNTGGLVALLEEVEVALSPPDFIDAEACWTDEGAPLNLIAAVADATEWLDLIARRPDWLNQGNRLRAQRAAEELRSHASLAGVPLLERIQGQDTPEQATREDIREIRWALMQHPPRLELARACAESAYRRLHPESEVPARGEMAHPDLCPF